MDIHFDWKASLRPAAQADITKRVTGTLRDFFKHCDTKITNLKVTALTLGPGGQAQYPVRILPADPNGKRPHNTVSVMIFTQGGQGLTSYLSAEGMTCAMLSVIIERGPYKKRKPLQELAPIIPAVVVKPSANPTFFQGIQPPMRTLVQSTIPHAGQRSMDQPKMEIKTLPQTVKPGTQSEVVNKVTRLNVVLETLKKFKVSSEEIEHLKRTLASIVYRQYKKDGRQANDVLVSSQYVTEAIVDHMILYTKQHEARSFTPNFHKYRIKLFALKKEMFWSFDRSLVVDFVGGENELIFFAKEREKEISLRPKQESDKKQAKALFSQKAMPTKMQETTHGIFLQDSDTLLETTRTTIEGKRVAEGGLANAKHNEEVARQRLEEIKHMFTQAETELAEAEANTRQAELKLKDFQISPETLDKIREAKKRFDSLAKDLGI